MNNNRLFNSSKTWPSLPVFFLLSFLLHGCVPRITNLQKVEVNTPPKRDSIRITENKKSSEVEIHTFFSFNEERTLKTKARGHTLVNSDGIYEVESVPGETFFIERAGVNTQPFEGDNFFWYVPEMQFGFDLDFALTKGFGLTGGLSYASINERDFWSPNFGFAIFSELQTWTWRIDMNTKFHQSNFTAEVIKTDDITLTGNETREVLFLTLKDQDTHNDPTLAFTLNTRRQEWPLNIFLNYTFGRQTFYDVEGDLETLFNEFAILRYSQSYNTFSAGLFKTFSKNGRILLGVRLTKYTDEKSQLSLPDAFVQYDFRLF